MKTIIISIFLCAIIIQGMFAQQPPGVSKVPKGNIISEKSATNKKLSIGDRIPNVELTVLNEGIVAKKHFYDFKQSLIILDFWDTSCKSCIEEMPRLDTLKVLFGNKVLILPVTIQNEGLIKSFLKNNRFLKSNNVKLHSVVNDKLLSQYFKHRGVPHVAWIYKGIVKAITSLEYVSAENIQTILDGKEVNWPVKNDFLVYDYKNSPLVNIDENRFVPYSSFKRYVAVTGYMQDIPRKSGSIRDTLNKTIRDYNFNSTIIQAYYHAMSMIRPFPFSPVPNRMVLEVKDKNRYIFNKTSKYFAEWNINNAICFESVVLDTTSEAARGNMIVEQLNHLLDLNARLEKRKVKCLVITKTGQQLNKAADSISFFNNGSINDLINRLNISNLVNGLYPPIVDETNYSGILSLNEWKDVPSLKMELHKQGFDINEREREVELFVLTENDCKK